jgi:hypothetical protein
MSDETLLVLLEFTGISPGNTFKQAIPDRPKARTLVIDPVKFTSAITYGPLGEIAREIAVQIMSRQVSRVAMTGACVATNLLGPVASYLAEAGAELPVVAAVAPQIVTPEIFGGAAVEILRNLDCQSRQLPEEISGLADNSCPAEVLGQAGNLIRVQLQRYMHNCGLGLLENNELCQELLEKYCGWLSMLLSCMHYGEQYLTAQVTDVFIPEEDAAENGYGTLDCSVRRHTYEISDASALLRDGRLGTDLRQILGEAGWRPDA